MYRHLRVLIIVVALLAGIAVGSSFSHATATAAAPTHGDIERLAGEGGIEHTTCGMSGFFGSLLCDFTIFFAEITDASFALLNIFLHVPPFTILTSTGGESSVYSSWSVFRGIANGLFVVGFLYVIYSHLTGIGVSNYNIKRMLPRIIIAALLVNLSFYITALAVDLSNVLGTTLRDVMVDASNQAIFDDADNPVMYDENGNLVNTGQIASRPDGHGTWSQIAGSTLLIAGTAGAAVSTLMYGSFATFLPILTSAVVAIVTTVLILLIRQVLIIAFIILSPLAFAAIILPGTMKYFEKWRSLFIPILLVFPAISLLYGAGHIASIAIHAVALGNDSVLLSIAALGVQVIPLLLTPAVMKLGSGLIDRWGGISQTPGKALRKKSENYAKKLDTKADLRALKRGGVLAANPRAFARRRRMGREARNKRIEDTRKIASDIDMRAAIDDDTPALFGDRTKGEALQQQLAQSTDLTDMRRAKNQVIREKVKAHAGDVEAKAIAMQSEPRNDLLKKATDQAATLSALEKEAAIMRLASVGDVGAIIDMMKHSDTMTVQQRQTLLHYADKSGATNKIPFLQDSGVRDALLEGGISESNFTQVAVMPSLATGSFSASELATDVDKDALDIMAEAIDSIEKGDQDLLMELGRLEADKNYTDQELLQQGRDKLKEYQDAAYEAISTEYTAVTIDKNHEPLHKMARVHLRNEAELENWFFDRNNPSGGSTP